MRRVFSAIAGVSVVVAIAASAASGANNAVKCGHLYQPACKPPAIQHRTVSVGCHKPGAAFTLPSITVSAVAGLKKVTVTVHSRARTILTLSHFNGARHRNLTGLTINTHGLGSGAHVIFVTVIDTRGKKTVQAIPFAICKPKPRTAG
jgi:hypothetical protein